MNGLNISDKMEELEANNKQSKKMDLELERERDKARANLRRA